MSDIVAMIPLKDGHELKYETLCSIAEQTVRIDIVCVSRPMKSLEGEKNKEGNGWLSMSECRNIAKEDVLARFDHDKFLLLNRDVVFSSATDVEDMMRFLDEDVQYGLVALNTRNRKIIELATSHVDIACSVVHRYALEHVVFHNDKGCNCNAVRSSIRRLDKRNKLRYLDKRQLKEI